MSQFLSASTFTANQGLTRPQDQLGAPMIHEDADCQNKDDGTTGQGAESKNLKSTKILEVDDGQPSERSN